MLRRVLCKNLYVDAGGAHVGRFHLSYGDYIDLSNGPFGVLEALNDFLVEPGGGFGAHSHEETEIISYCVAGELSHSDSHGNVQRLRRGDVGYQCAGSGIVHAEENRSADTPVRFVQVLFKPNAIGLTPSYAALRLGEDECLNRWRQIVSWRSAADTIRINQDVNAFVAETEQETSLPVAVSTGRQVYLVCLEGRIAVGDLELGESDAIRIMEAGGFSLVARQDSHLLLVDVAESE